MKIKEDNLPHQSSNLKSIGQVLKEKREELSFSLEHISEISRISLSSLRNIEEGNLKDLPGLVFVRGFIRNYSKLLGIDSDGMVKKLNQSFSEPDTLSSQKEDGQLLKQTSPDNNKEQGFASKFLRNQNSILWAAILLFFLVTIIVGVWTYKAIVPSSSDHLETIQAIELEQAEPYSSTGDPLKTSHKPIPDVVLPNAIISPLNLVLIGNLNEWVRLSIDSQPAIEQKLKVGEKYEWPANEIYELTMTDGNTARIYLNGEEIEINEQRTGKLFHKKLNKFSLTQLNN